MNILFYDMSAILFIMPHDNPNNADIVQKFI